MIKLPDSRNENILININGELYPRDEAKVSVFDSVVQGGDAVWEGLRIYDKKVFMLEEHLDRMQASAKAMAFDTIPSKEEIKEEIFKTLKANNMYDECHIRLTLTRGKKVTSGMSPHFNQYGPTLIVLAEWKKPVYDNNGIRLITSSIRRNPPQCVDSKIHHNNLINNILAKIEANLAGVEDAVMLDIEGFVSETNATNIFIVKKDVVYTPFADSCLPGITRGNILRIGEENGLQVKEKRISISEMYSADEVFVTGTMGEITPVLEIDGRKINSKKGAMTSKIQALYSELVKREAVTIPQ
ncbi:branched-chain-amino-acid transaminase [Fulvivirga lutea]|uniref:Branched-chain-amino-acid aminotransferase n=1 Tax=Fulvivirga lutea TaxID=2810512 RepID=A0A975A161_9BACT|nr:branched-chain-amino-acid transaminase [Fulvivirga lutea]QSE98109.1 branched-chain-amino-acid transaminase [Fulvivirga lutea]